MASTRIRPSSGFLRGVFSCALFNIEQTSEAQWMYVISYLRSLFWSAGFQSLSEFKGWIGIIPLGLEGLFHVRDGLWREWRDGSVFSTRGNRGGLCRKPWSPKRQHRTAHSSVLPQVAFPDCQTHSNPDFRRKVLGKIKCCCPGTTFPTFRRSHNVTSVYGGGKP